MFTYLCIFGILVSGLQLLESNEKRPIQQYYKHPTDEALKEIKSHESYLIRNLTSGDSLNLF